MRTVPLALVLVLFVATSIASARASADDVLKWATDAATTVQAQIERAASNTQLIEQWETSTRAAVKQRDRARGSRQDVDRAIRHYDKHVSQHRSAVSIREQQINKLRKLAAGHKQELEKRLPNVAPPKAQASRFGLPPNNRRNSDPGWRQSTKSFHNGIDFSSKDSSGNITNLEFTAGVSGRVHIHEGSDWNTVSVITADGKSIQFLHADWVDKSLHGKPVTPDTVLGKTGDKGSPGSLHLHVQVRDKNNKIIDPDAALAGYADRHFDTTTSSTDKPSSKEPTEIAALKRAVASADAAIRDFEVWKSRKGAPKLANTSSSDRSRIHEAAKLVRVAAERHRRELEQQRLERERLARIERQRQERDRQAAQKQRREAEKQRLADAERARWASPTRQHTHQLKDGSFEYTVYEYNRGGGNWDVIIYCKNTWPINAHRVKFWLEIPEGTSANVGTDRWISGYGSLGPERLVKQQFQIYNPYDENWSYWWNAAYWESELKRARIQYGTDWQQVGSRYIDP